VPGIDHRSEGREALTEVARVLGQIINMELD
jgi:hypothetical protein